MVSKIVEIASSLQVLIGVFYLIRVVFAYPIVFAGEWHSSPIKTAPFPKGAKK